jgi:hypothetical protein
VRVSSRYVVISLRSLRSLRGRSASCLLLLALSATGARAVQAQAAPSLGVDAPLTAFANLDRASAIAEDTPIRVTLSRPLRSDEGDLALVVGDMDVTAVSERTGSSITYRPAALALPSGETEAVVYRRAAGRWTEIRRFPMHVVQATGLAGLAANMSATLGNKGQIAEGHSGNGPLPDRRTFQDFVLNAGVHSSRERQGVTVTTQSNYIGVTRREEALRFGSRGRDAPMFDLSDYVVGLRSGNTSLSLGQVSFGSSRQLINGFGARGTTLTWSRGSTTMSVGALNGSAQVGWSDPIGLERASNRLFGAQLGREIVASHPGVFRVDVTLLDGSKLPQTSFTQSAIVDAEQSAGGTVQVSAAVPSQRVRFVSGYSRSRFENPRRDNDLLGNLAVPRPTPVTRGALFAEGTASLLQNAHPLGAGVPTNFTLGARLERVDPLYRSIGASIAADRQESAADATVSLGVVSAQFSQLWNHDNLGGVASVLRTNGRGSNASIAVPLGAIGDARRHQAYFPTLTFALNQTHQFAAGLPVNGAFRETDLPNQVSTNGDAAATWQITRVRFTLHANRSAQDNRQALREQADFAAGVNALSVGTTLGTRGDAALDLGDEFQTSKERSETTRIRRVTATTNVRPFANTSLVGAFSLLHTRSPTGTTSVNGDQRVELSQNLTLSPNAGASRGQLFLRYARTTSLLPDFGSFLIPAPRLRQQQWTLASGLNVRFF